MSGASASLGACLLPPDQTRAQQTFLLNTTVMFGYTTEQKRAFACGSAIHLVLAPMKSAPMDAAIQQSGLALLACIGAAGMDAGKALAQRGVLALALSAGMNHPFKEEIQETAAACAKVLAEFVEEPGALKGLVSLFESLPSDEKFVYRYRWFADACVIHDLATLYQLRSKWRQAFDTLVKKKSRGFQGVDLQHYNLSDLNLSNFDFRNANLRGAILIGTNLKGADLTGADMRETLPLTITRNEAIPVERNGGEPFYVTKLAMKAALQAGQIEEVTDRSSVKKKGVALIWSMGVDNHEQGDGTPGYFLSTVSTEPAKRYSHSDCVSVRMSSRHAAHSGEAEARFICIKWRQNPDFDQEHKGCVYRFVLLPEKARRRETLNKQERDQEGA